MKKAIIFVVMLALCVTGCGAGVLNFATREIRALEEHCTGFGLGDYYIDCDWNAQRKSGNSRSADILVFYCPVR